MPLNTVETDTVSFYSAVETTMGTRQQTVRSKKLNSYSDYGITVNTVARNLIGNNRMQDEGTVTSFEHKVGWNQDLTQTNTKDIIPAVLFTDLRETPKTNPLFTNIFGNVIPITSMTVGTPTGGTTFGASGGGLTRFALNNLVMLDGFSTPTNNREARIIANPSSTSLVIGSVLDSESLSGKNITLRTIGQYFPSSDVSLTYTTGSTIGTITATTSSTIFQDLNIVAGMILILDANDADNVLGATNRGYIRVRSVGTVGSNSVLTFDYSSFTPVTNSGSGNQIKIYWGDYIKNGVGANIVDKTLTTLRTIPVASGTEWDVKVGTGIDEFKFNIPKPASDAKVNIDVTGMSMSTLLYAGGTSKPTATLTEISELNCYSTANEIISARLFVRTGATTPFPSRIAAYVSDGTISIKNNISIPTAWGSTDGFDVNKGKIEVTGDLNIYYRNLDITQSIKSKDMFGLSVFFGRPISSDYAEGIFIDIPYMQVQSDGEDLGEDGIIMKSIKFTSVRDTFLSEVVSFSYFHYMPRHILTALGASVV